MKGVQGAAPGSKDPFPQRCLIKVLLWKPSVFFCDGGNAALDSLAPSAQESE